MFKYRGIELTGLALSLIFHTLTGASLAFFHFRHRAEDLALAIEPVYDADRPAEEFTRELNSDTEVAETLNIVPGGGSLQAVGLAVGSGTGGGGGGTGGGGGFGVSDAKINGSGQFRDPTINVGAGEPGLPGRDTLGTDLGQVQIKGEPTAVAEGYGAALGRITQELLRMLREEKLLVVWLFDESESMKDDQKEIREQFHKVYEELGIATERDPKMRMDKETLLTAVHSFGETATAITPKPTADIPEIRSAIDKIGIDKSGIENMFGALNKVLDQYRVSASRARRKLVIIIVTDESGDDGQGPLLDEAIRKAVTSRAPVYVLGRESVFGFPIARMRWVDPKYGLSHWLEINRGPETAMPEALQFDGLHERWDAHSSGFAPYEQARLTKETGGIFFVLPHEEESLVGQAAIDKRKFAFLDMKEYTPELVPRRKYEELRAKSKFRTAVWDVVKLLNPFLDPKLRIQETWYSSDPARFKPAGQESFERALRAMGLLNQAVQVLDRAKPLRDREESQRWRADFDLVYAQVLAYRVRLFQFLLAMDAYLNNFPKPKNPQNNVWNIIRVHEMIAPTDRQIKLTKVDMDELKKQLEAAKSQFDFVRKTHPGTPWAHRAEYELGQGFGMTFQEGFRDPRYDRISIEIKIPKL
ncbi:MAG TPA: vWA domain-containing protein [Planctomycetaceae bacterium]|nr:vWA domain-containing protein [Planctomycetaceae bacterium]